MEYRYYITEEIRNKYFRRFPIIKSFLLGIENNTEQLYSETNIKGILIQNISINKKAMTLIWLPKYYQQYCIYILRYVNESDDYNSEVNYDSRTKFAEHLSLFSISEEREIGLYFQTLSQIDDNITNPKLSEEEDIFLNKVISFNHQLLKDEPVIYETDNWISDITNVSEVFSSIARNIYEYVEYGYVESHNYGWGRTKSLSGKFAVIFREDNNWILDGLKDDGFDLALERPKPMDLKRGYPYTLLEDPIKWIKMENVTKSNLALSEEQIKYIAAPIKYPLFITGRAGSGKSTALLYIFAEVMVRWSKLIKECGDDSIKEPLYLSYSKELIDDAKELTTNLFSHNHALRDYSIGYHEDLEPHLDDIFMSFDELRRECVKKHQPELLEKRFSVDKKISFKIFKEKWNEEFAYDRDLQKKCGANISWYIIRTYIKGWNYDSFMDEEGYKNLSRKQRQGNVSDETFKVVYKRVWKGWYEQLTKEDYWDDLDIARCCLNNNWVDERFSAIFCDEAQDFTRVEIDFILRLSSFTNRLYDSPDYIQKLPFAFAGDEFQTLSPTGFSWESIRGYFIDRLFELTGLNTENDDTKKSLPDPIAFLENYRSEPEIVKTANRIQLLRAARFNNYSDPQKPHFISGDDLCFRVPLKAEPKVWDNVTSDYEIAIIVPKDESESYYDYIIRTGDLKNYIIEKIVTDEGKEEYKIKDFITMLTPSSAKGGEYPNVLLYGFGKDEKYDDVTVDRLLKWFQDPQNDTNKDIELENIICNMYVALTRATKHIYIIDDFSNDSIWSFLLGSNKPNLQLAEATKQLQIAMIDYLGNKKDGWEKASTDNLLGWVYDISEKEGQKMTFTTLSTEERLKMYNDYRTSYFRNEESACLEELRQLANQFKRLGKTNDYFGCLADAAKKEGKYTEAAKLYINAKEYLNALDSYWIELCKPHDQQQITSIINDISSLDAYIDDPRSTWCAKVYSNNIHPKDIEELLSVVLKETFKVVSSIASWEVLYKKALEIANRQDPLGSEICNFDRIIKTAEELKITGFVVDYGKIADMAYRFHAEDDAIKIWESQATSELPEYYYSLKWKKTNYPEKLQYAKEMGDNMWAEKVIDLYKQNRKRKLTDKQRGMIYEAIRTNKKKDDYEEFFLELLESLSDSDSCMQFINEAHATGLNVNSDIFEGYIHLWLEDNREWEPTNKYKGEAMLLIAAADDAKNLRKKDYLRDRIDSIKKEISTKKGISKDKVRTEEIVESCCSNYRKYINSPIASFIFKELGKAFESHGHWLSAVVYYEWLDKQPIDLSLKKEMAKQWVYCKEKQAEKTDKEESKNFHQAKAREKREDLGIVGLPLTKLSLYEEDWNNLFSYLMTVEVEPNNDHSLSEIIELEETDNKETESFSIPSLSPNKQELSYRNYRIIIVPKRGDIIIREEETENQTILRKGIFKEDDYYSMNENGRLVNKDLEQATPFVVKNSNHIVELNIYDGSDFSGFSIQFNTDLIPSDDTKDK